MATTEKMLEHNIPSWLDETNKISVIVRQSPIPAMLLMEFIADMQNQGLGIIPMVLLDRKTHLFTVTFRFTKIDTEINEAIYHMCRDYIINGTRFLTEPKYDHTAGGKDQDWQGGFDR